MTQEQPQKPVQNTPQSPDDSDDTKFNADNDVSSRAMQLKQQRRIYNVYNTIAKKDYVFDITFTVLPLWKEKEIEAKVAMLLSEQIGDRDGFGNQPRRLISKQEVIQRL